MTIIACRTMWETINENTKTDQVITESCETFYIAKVGVIAQSINLNVQKTPFSEFSKFYVNIINHLCCNKTQIKVNL